MVSKKWMRNHDIPAKTMYDIFSPISNKVKRNSSFFRFRRGYPKMVIDSVEE
jgi:hypothetical protein